MFNGNESSVRNEGRQMDSDSEHAINCNQRTSRIYIFEWNRNKNNEDARTLYLQLTDSRRKFQWVSLIQVEIQTDSNNTQQKKKMKIK